MLSLDLKKEELIEPATGTLSFNLEDRSFACTLSFNLENRNFAPVVYQ